VSNNRLCLSFSSNDYLGLANHPAVVSSCRDSVRKHGVGSGASQLLGGYSFSHRALEEELAEFLGYERVMLFSSGYMANLGVITALFGGKDKNIFVDRLSHASLIDGSCYSGANFKRYKHLDICDLVRLLKLKDTKYKLILSEGVFSMEGDIAPLPELVTIAKNTASWFMFDDAHGIGVLGSQGRGVMEHYGVSKDEVQILVGTFGKAFGTFGAFVASNETIIESLIQFARTYIYTTALPVAIVDVTRTSLRLVQHECWRRNYLNGLIKKFKQKAQQLGLPLLPSNTPIQSLIIRDICRANKIMFYLQQQGIKAALVRPPTVPVNTTRLRISLTVNHTEEHVDYLLDILNQAFIANP